MKPSAAALLSALLALAANPAGAERAEYAIDPVHSRIVFSVDHAGFSRSLATLGRIEGRLLLDPEDWESAEVQVRIPLDTLDFGDTDWNRQMAGRRWFDVGRHPHAHFTSTRVQIVEQDQLRVTGSLRIRGQSTLATLDVRINEVGRNPMTHRPTAGFSATTTLDRRAFGLVAFPTVVGNEVDVRIELEARRGRANTPSPATDEAAPTEEEEEEA